MNDKIGLNIQLLKIKEVNRHDVRFRSTGNL